MSPDNEEGLEKGLPPISLEFKLPEPQRHEIYPVVLEDGSVVFRTKEELERAKPPETPEEEE